MREASAAKKGLKQKFSELSKANRVQLILASFLSLVLVVGLPVYAWFAMGGKLEAFTKIKEPDNLDIRAGHYDDVQYFELKDIDIEAISKEGGCELRVFSVSGGDYKIPYQLQIAHTTNIPFKYEIYRATEYSYNEKPQNPDVTYISEPLKAKGLSEEECTFYYTMGEQETLHVKNPDDNSVNYYGRLLADNSDKYYSSTYDSVDDPEIYAVPIYEQTGRLTSDEESDHDYYILKISWDREAAQEGNFSEWNKPENLKETDMFYLTASRYTE